MSAPSTCERCSQIWLPQPQANTRSTQGMLWHDVKIPVFENKWRNIPLNLIIDAFGIPRLDPDAYLATVMEIWDSTSTCFLCRHVLLNLGELMGSTGNDELVSIMQPGERISIRWRATACRKFDTQGHVGECCNMRNPNDLEHEYELRFDAVCSDLTSAVDATGVEIIRVRLADSENGMTTFRPEHSGSDPGGGGYNSWYMRCESDHTLCSRRMMSSNARLPASRILKIDRLNQRLYLISQIDFQMVLPDKAKYGTVSHRWKKDPGTILKTYNTDWAKNSGFGFTNIDEDLKSAVLILNDLGIGYVWIDSLCIIQDSKEDWLSQSQVMGQIYANSDCNVSLAITDSPKHHYNLDKLVQRQLPEKTITMPVGSIGRQHQDVPSGSSDPARRKLIAIDASTWTTSVLSAPLNKRAWVVQERIMSPRIIHVTSESEYFWECRTQRSSTDFREGIPSSLWPIDIKHPMVAATFLEALDRFRSESRLKTHQLDAVYPLSYWYWCLVVSAYSKAGLTRDGDRLVAIAGIASIMQQVLGQSEYLAGLWRSHLIQELLWTCDGPEAVGTVDRPDDYCPPSWSWASLKCSVQPYHLSVESNDAAEVVLTKVLEAEVVPTDGPFGYILTGFITFRGHLKRCNLISSATTQNLHLEMNLQEANKDSYALQGNIALDKHMQLRGINSKRRDSWGSLDEDDTVSETETPDTKPFKDYLEELPKLKDVFFAHKFFSELKEWDLLCHNLPVGENQRILNNLQQRMSDDCRSKNEKELIIAIVRARDSIMTGAKVLPTVKNIEDACGEGSDEKIKLTGITWRIFHSESLSMPQSRWRVHFDLMQFIQLTHPGSEDSALSESQCLQLAAVVLDDLSRRLLPPAKYEGIAREIGMPSAPDSFIDFSPNPLGTRNLRRVLAPRRKPRLIVPESDISKTVYCLPVLVRTTKKRKDKTTSGTATIECLLLMRSDASEPGRYERCGRFTSSDSVTVAMLQQEEMTPSLREDEYEARSRDGSYRITVV